MLYRFDLTDFPFNESHAGFDAESLLPQSGGFRYDRSHAGAAADAADQSAHDEGEAHMDVTGPGSVGGAGPIRPTHMQPTPNVSPTPPGIEMPVDEVEISSAARALEKLSHDPQVRAARLAEIQSQIAAGTYETPEKLEAAVMRMMSQMG